MSEECRPAAREDDHECDFSRTKCDASGAFVCLHDDDPRCPDHYPASRVTAEPDALADRLDAMASNIYAHNAGAVATILREAAVALRSRPSGAAPHEEDEWAWDRTLAHSTDGEEQWSRVVRPKPAPASAALRERIIEIIDPLARFSSVERIIQAHQKADAVLAEIDHTNLFRDEQFTSHSGAPLDWKIDCDALTDVDLRTLAKVISSRIAFSEVRGVPRGGLALAAALAPYSSGCDEHPVLLVDDVLTTGASMEELRATVSGPTIGVVLFARGRLPEWIQAVFRLGYPFREPFGNSSPHRPLESVEEGHCER